MRQATAAFALLLLWSSLQAAGGSAAREGAILGSMGRAASAGIERPEVRGAGSSAAQNGTAASAAEPLRWMYELKAGSFHPRLEQYSAYYGDDRSFFFSLSAAYRFRPWLEAGAEIGRMRDHGAGRAAGGSARGGTVTYTLTPVEVFASFMLERPGSRWVPYLSLGAAAIAYDENIDLQPDRTGRSGIGGAESAGVRWRFASQGGDDAGSSADTPWRGYVFLEAQHISGEAAGFDLGGTAYLVGVRIEFDFAGREAFVSRRVNANARRAGAPFR